MKMSRVALIFIPPLVMLGVCVALTGSEHRLSALATTSAARLMLGRIGIALPYLASAAVGVIFLFAAAGAVAIRSAGWGVIIGNACVVCLAIWRETARLFSFARSVPSGKELISYTDPATLVGATLLVLSCAFALRVAIRGNGAFAAAAPRRLRGKRAAHGEADWMSIAGAARLFPEAGGIVIGECYRVDKDNAARRAFRSDDRETWGSGGHKALLGFDGSFGSSHGIVFAGSGGFKTTSVTVPTSLRWGGPLVVLDPSNEVAPMVQAHRMHAGRKVFTLDARHPEIGFNALDWIGAFGSTKEEDITAVASWIITDNPRLGSARDDFFRGSALQLLTALIADVCISGHTEKKDQHLRQVRTNLSEPEPKLRERLQAIYDKSESEFVRENIAPFVNMTAETFSGVYANAAKETHWLSYRNYAALVSGSSFSTAELGNGETDVFINLDLKALENHPGLARLIIGSMMNAIYNRNGEVGGRTLFLLDEVARLGYMRILETARDAGRKYGITLLMLFQSIGQMREAYGGRDATSKWFESASWVSFAAVNDPETAEYVSRRCGDTTIEVDQTSSSSRMSGSSRTRSRQLSRRPLIMPHEVMQMRSDEQIVFTAGNPPLRCGRAIFFRRQDMTARVKANRFAQPSSREKSARTDDVGHGGHTGSTAPPPMP